MTEIFGAGPAAPEPFVPPAVNDDFGPKFVPKEYIGSTVIVQVSGVSEFDDQFNGGKKQAIDAESILVVESGERFERQRLFDAGIVRQLKGMAGKQVIAGVGTYSTEKFPKRQFVELKAPSADQVAAAKAALAGDSPAPKPAATDAPF